ncbi:MAG: response regulator [Anaerolineaceae bacterium]|nr:response regulator [Anaerolineaceae bacterium]MCB9099032.1 response regulator [Anaerolineales bacterium]
MTNPLALIIEDEDDLATIFSIALQTAKFEPEIIYDGQAALARLAEVAPAIVVLDLHIPGVSGQKILDYILTEPQFAQTHVIIATADARLGDTLRDKATLVLLKPVSPGQLRLLAKRLHPSENADN